MTQINQPKVIISVALYAASRVYKTEQGLIWSENVGWTLIWKLKGTAVLWCRRVECSLTNGLVFSLSPGICECFRGAGEVLFTAAESVASAGKLTSINLQKVRCETLACSGDGILIQPTSFKSHIPRFAKLKVFLIGVLFRTRFPLLLRLWPPVPVSLLWLALGRRCLQSCRSFATLRFKRRLSQSPIWRRLQAAQPRWVITQCCCCSRSPTGWFVEPPLRHTFLIDELMTWTLKVQTVR